MKKPALLSAFCLLFFANAPAQLMESGDISAVVSDLVGDMPGNSGNDYTVPTAEELTDWETMFNNLLAAQYNTAAAQAAALDYELIEFSDTPTGETYYLLKKTDAGANYWGTYVLNPDACRDDLILMAPHPRFDLNTGKQAAFCFQTLDALFFMMSGTHRCNHDDASDCDGETTACSSPIEAPFRISDMAHVTNAIWQRSTERLLVNFPDAFFVQLHGFTKLVSDPYVILSNGTRMTPMPDPLITLRDQLLIVDPTLTFKIAHIDLAWDKLIALTNTNGRLVNGSPDPCFDDAMDTEGRFLHIEQERTKLRDDETGWNKMATALGATFGPGCALLPLELSAFHATLAGDSTRLDWTTVFEFNHDYFSIERSVDGVKYTSIGIVSGAGNSSVARHYTFWDKPAPGNNYYRLREVDTAGEERFSQVVHLYYQPDGEAGAVVFFARDQLTVRTAVTEQTPCSFQLYDLLGRLVMEQKITRSETHFAHGLHIGGIYVYRIAGAHGILYSGKVWIPKSF
jgi:hypothetical protein